MHLWHRWVPVKAFGYVATGILGFQCKCGARKIVSTKYQDLHSEVPAKVQEAYDWLNSTPKPSKPPIKLKTSPQDHQAWRELEEPLDFGHQDLMNLLDDIQTLLKRVEEG